MVVIPKSVSPKRIAENIRATQLQLDAEDSKRIEALDKPGARMFRVAIHIIITLIYVVVYTQCHNKYTMSCSLNSY